MHDISKRLLYYKRKEIQEAIADSSKDREVGSRFGSGGYGKRPDVLMYASDVFALVKKGATSFHLSEERWTDPMQIVTGMSKKELNEIRSGWDLVLDIDCPHWNFSKLTTYLFVESLKRHGIKSITCKFSGNKGFHIGVPFEAFPDSVNGIPTREWFPQGPRKVASYLLDYIAENLIEVKEDRTIIFGGAVKSTIEKISKTVDKPIKELTHIVCPDCKSQRKEKESKVEFICKKCEKRIKGDPKESHMVCSKCNKLMEKIDYVDAGCRVCGSGEEGIELFNPLSIVEVDTLLISSRHMYRAPYSMHEKSGLASMLIPLDKILSFEKKQAEPKRVVPNMKFLDATSTVSNEAELLLQSAADHGKENIQYKQSYESQKTSNQEYDVPENAIPMDFFPPSILNGLSGLRDGKKRFLFILQNFLSSCGWSYELSKELILKWNKKNPEPLRDNYLQGQLRYFKRNKKSVLPPNYSSTIYKDLGLGEPEEITKKYKNPVAYTRRIYEQSKRKRKRKRKGRGVNNENKEK